VGKVVEFRRHAVRASAGSSDRTKLDAGISPPISLSIRTANGSDRPRLPLRISDRCGSEQPTASAKAERVPLASIKVARRDRPSMPQTLPQANRFGQEKLCCGEIDILLVGADDAPMKEPRSIKEPTLYIREWIQALDLQPRAIAKKAKVSEPYFNQLIHRKKENPSLKVLVRIADAMGVGLRDLQMPPPSPEVLKAIQIIPSDQIERLRQRRKVG
jgi:hypothetical protein